MKINRNKLMIILFVVIIVLLLLNIFMVYNLSSEKGAKNNDKVDVVLKRR
jgi:flagellar basal body-associated protein FliL